MSIISLSIPSEMLEKVDYIARNGDLPSDRSKIVRRAISEYLERRVNNE